MMLANLFEGARTNVMHEFKDFKNKFFHDLYITSDYPADFEKQWTAGLLYGGTKGVVDQRDYILDCMKDNDGVIQALTSAYDHFNENTEDGIHAGNKDLNKATRKWRNRAMRKCKKTNGYFDDWMDAKDDFMDQDDWESITNANYEANKDYIDQQWGYMMK